MNKIQVFLHEPNFIHPEESAASPSDDEGSNVAILPNTSGNFLQKIVE